RVDLITQSKETESPVGPRSDEVGKKKEKEKEEKGEEKKNESKDKTKKPAVVKVDTDGIHDRIVALDIQPANYSNLRLVDDRVFYLRRTVGDDKGGDDEEGGEARKLHLAYCSLEHRKETELSDVTSYEITGDGKKVLFK